MYNIIKVFHLGQFKGGVTVNCFLFNGLTDDELLQLNKLIGKAQIIPKGEELYRCGALGIIKSGSATVKRNNETGNSVNMRTIGSYEVFGAASVFGNWREGSSSIKALENCEVYYINEAVFHDLLLKYPTVSINYISYLSDKIRFLNRRIDAFTAGSTQNKLYEYLVSISNNGSAVLNISMSELARRLKIGRSSLYRDIQSLEQSGLIKRDGQNFKIL